MKKRLFALLLAAAMVLSLFGCTQEPIPTEPSAQPTQSTEPPTEPPLDGAQIYADASAALGADVTLDVVTTKTTTFGGQILTEETVAELSYSGMGTENPKASWEETVSSRDPGKEDKLVFQDTLYKESYADGELYIELKDRVHFCVSMTPEELASRYIPAVLLDAALYEDIQAEKAGDVITLTFAAPTAAETWAMPADAELVEATGTATVTGGSLTAMTYTVTYDYGSVTVTQTTESKPRAQAEAVTLPPAAGLFLYKKVQSPDALRLYLQMEERIFQAHSGTFTSVNSTFSQAAGVLNNQVMTTNFYDKDQDLRVKSALDMYIMDYYNNESYPYSLESIYQDGKYEFIEDGGEPVNSDSERSEDELRDAYRMDMLSAMYAPENWTDVTVEDLGSLYYMEFEYSDLYADSMQDMACEILFSNAGFLNSYASAYMTNEFAVYMSIDKYTGLLVASGFEYQGTHTIDGYPYILTSQTDQSFTLPSLGAYKEITDEMPPEAEPENKATPLFYHVTGEGGQEMWLFGTIHVGDNRTAYLPQEIYDAFAASKALAIECDTEAFDEQMEEDEELEEKVSNLYFYDDGTTIADHIDAELYTNALKYLKATGNHNMNAAYMKPSIWSQGIENFFMRQGQTLTAEQGVEERLTKLAHDQEKEILEVESSLFQIEMTTGWSEDLHEQLLAESIAYSGEARFEGVNELYEMWCAGDEAALYAYLSDEVDTSEWTEEELAEYEASKELREEYNNAMSIDRNEGMLKKAIEYLESGDVIFYAVGLAHLLDSTNGLVEALRQAGYTVELVTFQ